MRYAFLSGAQDYASIYTWKSWLGGWFVRVLSQVVFFALIGKLLRSDQQTWYLLVGNAVMLAAMEGIWALNLVNWERDSGTLQLLAASPSNPVVVFAARGSYLIADGLASSLGALLVVGLLFRLPLPWPRVLLVIPLTLLVGASGYCFGTFLAGILIRARNLNGIVSNVGIITFMTLCGVNVPLAAYPAPVAFVAKFVPLTHGLVAIRDVLAGNLGPVAGQAGLEAAVGLAWLGLCLVTFGRFVRHGRRDGSLEFAN
ncbi:MAG TPA: ABC transporter permease [Micromonosporaceae bacterium]|nr:ABC transporter permease [Micromonosporaceae bacterium]